MSELSPFRTVGISVEFSLWGITPSRVLCPSRHSALWALCLLRHFTLRGSLLFGILLSLVRFAFRGTDPFRHLPFRLSFGIFALRGRLLFWSFRLLENLSISYCWQLGLKSFQSCLYPKSIFVENRIL